MKTFIAFLVAVATASSTVLAAPTVDWRAKAKRDLIFIHQFLVENHPGVLFKLDKEFHDWLQSGYLEAEKKLALVKSERDYQYLLSGYLQGFDQGHLSVAFKASVPPALKWPGFFAIDVKGKAMVIGNAASVVQASTSFNAEQKALLELPIKQGKLDRFKPAETPAQGDVLESCDGKSTERLISERVSPLRSGPGSKDLGTQILYTRLLFTDTGDPFWSRPKACTFIREGKKLKFTLKWSDLPVMLYSAMMGAVETGHMGHSVGLTVLPQGVWLNMPAFMGEGIDAAYLKMREDLKPELKKKPKTVIFDLRGNRGGSTIYARAFLRDIYGDKLYKKIEACSIAGYQVIRRATPAVLAQYREKQKPSSNIGREESDDISKALAGLGDAIENAMKKGNPSIGTSLDEFNKPLPESSEFEGHKDCKITEKEVKKYPRPVALFDQYCASACTMFLDDLAAFENRVFVGQPTPRRDPYMETGKVPLPSGFGSLHFPTMLERRTKQRLTYHPMWWMQSTFGADAEIQDRIAALLKEKYQIQ